MMNSLAKSLYHSFVSNGIMPKLFEGWILTHQYCVDYRQYNTGFWKIISAHPKGMVLYDWRILGALTRTESIISLQKNMLHWPH